MSTVRQERGVCYAHAFDGSSYGVDREDYPKLKTAWMAGIAFCEVRGLHGQPITLKLMRIEGISVFTPEQYAAYEADIREEKQQELLNGGDS